MAKKYYYYIGIGNTNGMRFVTSIDNPTRTAVWDESKKPKALPKSVAVSVAEALAMNGYNAVVIQAFYELENHFFIKEEN